MVAGRGAWEGKEGRTRVPVLASLAREGGISADHLTRLARAGGTTLGEVFDAWRMVLATVVWMEERSWETAARRLGFRGIPGFTALACWTLGRRLRELSEEPGVALALAEAHLMELMPGSGERMSAGVKKCRIEKR